MSYCALDQAGFFLMLLSTVKHLRSFINALYYYYVLFKNGTGSLLATMEKGNLRCGHSDSASGYEAHVW